MKSNKIYYSILMLLIAVTSLTGCKEDITHTEYLTTPSLKLEYAGEKGTDWLTVKITPNKYAKSYWYAIGTEADRESFEDGTYAGLHKGHGSDELSYTFTYLEPETKYTIFAIPFDADDKPGTLSMIKVETYTDAFAVEKARVMVNSATFTFKSTGDYCSYVYAVGKPGDKEAFENGTLEGIVQRDEYTEYSATVFDLKPETEYIFYAMGYDRLGRPTRTFEYPFKTLSAAEYPAVTSQKVEFADLLYTNYSVTVNEHCFRVGLLIDEQGYRDDVIYNVWGGRVLEMMDMWNKLGNLNIVGRAPVVGLEMRTDALFVSEDPFDKYYDVYAVLYDKNNEPFSVERFQYKTPSFDATAAPATVDVTVTEITAVGATYTIKPSSNAVGVVFETFDADWFDTSVANGTLTEKDILTYLRIHFFYGNNVNTFVETTVTEHPAQRAYVIAGAINKNGFVNGMSELKKVEYTTLP